MTVELRPWSAWVCLVTGRRRERLEDLVAWVACKAAADDAHPMRLAFQVICTRQPEHTRTILGVGIGTVVLDHALHDAVVVLDVHGMVGIGEPVGIEFGKYLS